MKRYSLRRIALSVAGVVLIACCIVTEVFPAFAENNPGYFVAIVTGGSLFLLLLLSPRLWWKFLRDRIRGRAR